VDLVLKGCRVRSWGAADAISLARHANNLKIWRNLRDVFPHPYTREAAEWWVARAAAEVPETQFAIEVDGEAAGGIGLTLREDVERRSAEVGYWLGEAYWGRGIATEALLGFTTKAFERYDLLRIYAGVFDGNPASCRVLEKAGYMLEGRLRRAVVKDGQVLDQLLFARVREASRHSTCPSFSGFRHPDCQRHR
jgi:RimJ/RimL family protein N-acetyltransferase